MQLLWNLALYYRDQEIFDIAEQKYQELVKGPEILKSLIQLALVTQQEKRYTQSEAQYRRLIKSCSKSWGMEDPQTLIAMHNRASVLRYQNETSIEKELLFRQVCDSGHKILGPHEDLRIKSLQFLANHLVDLGKDEEAKPLITRLPARFRRPMCPGRVWRCLTGSGWTLRRGLE